jgi:hypothetical protein
VTPPQPPVPDLGVPPPLLDVGDMMERIGRREKGPSARRLAEWLRQKTSSRGRKTRKPRTMPAGAYEASPNQVWAVRKLAALLLAAVLLSLLSVLWTRHFGLEASPPWARAVLLVAGLQCLYVVWMLNAPDWASVRVVMFVFAAVATGYAVATTSVMATPLDHPLALGLGSVRHRAAAWCGGMVAVMALGTFFCGRLSTRWRRVFQRETARRAGPPQSSRREAIT